MIAAITIGAELCYPAALPYDNVRQVLHVRVEQLARLASGRPGVWVIVTTRRLAGIAWQVAADELQECGR